MPQNFIDCDRDQAFLMPPSLRDWLPGDHLAWFVIETVEQLDLAAFYASYRPDGHGRAAYEPSVMVSLLMFAYSTNERSSRGIERHCRQDIAYRVITGNRVPDHATVARFIRRHVNGHRFLPIRGHVFSPLVAIFSPHWWPRSSPPVRVVKAGGHEAPHQLVSGVQARGLTPFPAVAWASR